MSVMSKEGAVVTKRLIMRSKFNRDNTEIRGIYLSLVMGIPYKDWCHETIQ